MSGTLLVCGSRDWSDPVPIRAMIRGLKPRLVVHGAARGADSMAGIICRAMGVEVKEFPADWDLHGRSAGPIRNQRMLEEAEPERVVAFKTGWDRTLKSGGTEDMIRRARKAGVMVYVVEHLL